jgi:hypothetical protein
LDAIQISLMHNEVELRDIIRASVLASLDTTLEDGYSHVQLDTASLLGKLADQKEAETLGYWSGSDEDGVSETGEKGGDEYESMDVDSMG